MNPSKDPYFQQMQTLVRKLQQFKSIKNKFADCSAQFGLNSQNQIRQRFFSMSQNIDEMAKIMDVKLNALIKAAKSEHTYKTITKMQMGKLKESNQKLELENERLRQQVRRYQDFLLMQRQSISSPPQQDISLNKTLLAQRQAKSQNQLSFKGKLASVPKREKIDMKGNNYEQILHQLSKLKNTKEKQQENSNIKQKHQLTFKHAARRFHEDKNFNQTYAEMPRIWRVPKDKQLKTNSLNTNQYQYRGNYVPRQSQVIEAEQNELQFGCMPKKIVKQANWNMIGRKESESDKPNSEKGLNMKHRYEFLMSNLMGQRSHQSTEVSSDVVKKYLI